MSDRSPDPSALIRAVAANLKGYDRAGLAATMGAIDLDPRNANQLLRTQLASRAVLSIVRTAGPLISASRLRRLMNTAPIADESYVRLEDPLNELVVEEIVLPIGTFRMSSGTTAEGVWVLERLVDAISRLSSIDRPAAARALQLAAAGAVIADSMYRKAGLERGTRPRGQHRGPVTVADSFNLDRLREAVTFKDSHVQDLLRHHRLSLESLSPILVEGDSGVTFEDPEPSAIQRPILREGGAHIVCSPSNLVGAICHAMVREIVRAGNATQLSEALVESGQNAAIWSLRLLGLGPPGQVGVADVPVNFRQTLHQFDADKLVHLLVLTDDFADFAEGDMDRRWGAPSLEATLSRLIEATEIEVFARAYRCNEVLHLIVLQASGRPGGTGVSGQASPTAAPILALSTSALRTISLLEAGNHTLLWYWATQRDRLFNRGTRTFAWNALDEFWLYRQYGHSYYLGDGRRPTFLTFDLYGVVESKQLVQAERDPRGIQRIDGEWTWAAKTAKDSERAYVQMAFGPIPPICIVGKKATFWLMPHAGENDIAGGIAAEIVRMMGYWLDETWNLVEEVIVGATTPFGLDLIFVGSPEWGVLPEPSDLDADPTALSRDESTGRLEVPPTILGLFARDDNAAERLLVRKALEHVFAVTNAGDPKLLAHRIVDQRLPIGRNRAMVTTSISPRSALDIQGLPEFRAVQDEARALVGDDLGDRLATGGVDTGVIAADYRGTVINRAVAILYDHMKRQVHTVRRDELLMGLMMHHERTIAERERSGMGLPTRLVDPKSTLAAAGLLREKLPALTTMALALRFLIEYVVAQPSVGMRPMSLTLVDELAAVSAELIQWGMESDLIAYDLADVSLTMLPSGRLGLSSSHWGEATEGFLAMNVEEQLAQTEPPRYQLREIPDQKEEFDVAAVAEFGVSFSRLAEVVGEILALGHTLDESAKRLEVVEFKTQLRAVGVTDVELELLFSKFSLGKRRAFLEPAPPATRIDVYPWRFNRQLSYIRRPLLLARVRDKDYVFWGNRHLVDSFENLVGLCRRGRLKAQSPSMAAAMGQRADIAGRAFSNSVADLFEAYPDFIVRRHVKKVGGIRLTRHNGDDIGDIDILAVDLRRRRVWAIEAKHLAGARTPHEIRNEINETLGGPQGNTGSAGRHLERTEWLRVHLVQLALWLGIHSFQLVRWRVRPLIVTDSDLLSANLSRGGIAVVSMRRLAEILSRDPGLLTKLAGRA